MQNNARLANKELAARLGLAPSTCLVRVRRLLQTGALRGFHAEVEPKALGIGLQALVFVRLVRHSRRTVDAFRKHALSLRETIALYHVAGQHDFLVHVGVRDADHLRDLGLDAFTTRKEVARLETHLIFEHSPSRALPLLLGPDGAPGADPARARG